MNTIMAMATRTSTMALNVRRCQGGLQQLGWPRETRGAACTWPSAKPGSHLCFWACHNHIRVSSRRTAVFLPAQLATPLGRGETMALALAPAALALASAQTTRSIMTSMAIMGTRTRCTMSTMATTPTTLLATRTTMRQVCHPKDLCCTSMGEQLALMPLLVHRRRSTTSSRSASLTQMASLCCLTAPLPVTSRSRA